MTKEYEQARDAAAKQILDLADRALWKGGATFATDYWAKEIERLKQENAKLKDALAQVCRSHSEIITMPCCEALAALQAWRNKHE